MPHATPVCHIYGDMCRGCVCDVMSQVLGLGGEGDGALVALVVVEVDVADGLAAGGVGGDVVVVADSGDDLAGAVAAEVDAGGSQVDVAGAADGELVDGGVVLAGQVAGPAVGPGVVPGVLRGGLDGGVVAAGVVVGPVGVE